jgi:Transcriptional Coactivator p15 (PC4)
VSARGPTLPEPIEVAKFWKSPRNRTEHVRVDLSEYQGHPLINVRIWQTGSDGIDRPTTKGIALAVRKLPELARSLAKAEIRARELGLLADDGPDA